MNTTKLLVLAGLALVAGGCIISSQLSLEVPFAVDQPFVNGVIKETLNLGDNDTWADNADKIEQIEKVEFDAVVVNALSAKDTLDMYVSATSTYTTRAQVKGASDAYPLLLNYVTPASSTDTLTRVESLPLLQLSGANFTNVKNLVKTGNFTAYITSSGGAAVGRIDTANVYITFTAGK